MRVIVGCEFSQIVTLAFRKKGHEAYSCDILPTEGNHPEWHFQEDILEVLKREKFDLGIFHPPCQYISYAATRVWNNPGRVFKRLEALNFFAKLWEAPIEKICIENPKGCASPTIAKYSQIIQPYYFGEEHLKTTCLWLKNLPVLEYTLEDYLFGKKTASRKPEPLYISQGVKTKGKKEYYSTMGNFKFKSKDRRSRERARFWPKIAEAMADAWG